MLCVGQPVNDPTTADFLNYWAEKAKGATNTSFGITSQNLRALPITRDSAYAEQRMRYFAGLAGIQQKLDTHQKVPVEQKLELSAGLEAFARPIKYADYAPSLEDTSPCAFRDSGPAAVLTAASSSTSATASSALTAKSGPPSMTSLRCWPMAQRQGIQINAVSRADVDRI